MLITKKLFSILESKKPVLISKSIDEPQQESPEINFKTYSVGHRKGNISYEGMHLTLFEDSNQCSLDQFGFRAQVFWLWKTHTCTPLYWEGQIGYYYVWNQTSLSMHCEDANCQICQFEIDQFNHQAQCSKIGKKLQFQKCKKFFLAFSKMAKNQFLHQKKSFKLHFW